LGCGLLLSGLALIQESKPDTFLGARPTIILKAERTKLLKNLKDFKRMSNIDYDMSESYNDGEESSENQDDPMAPPRRFSSTPVGRKSRFGRQPNERKSLAWASIYDASGATHSLVARTSTMFVQGRHEGGQSLMPTIESKDFDVDENSDEASSNDAEVTGVEESGNEKPSDAEYMA
jgi:hypothetical protein